jgi:hypothetical protein
MKIIKIISGIAAMLVLVVSCGQQKQNKSAQSIVAGENAVGTKGEPKIDKKVFAALLKDCSLKLPVSYMPEYLKTEEQRKKLEFPTGEEEDASNRLYHQIPVGDDGAYASWQMTGFATDDNRNIVWIVSYGSGFDWFTVELFKTLNYNIQTQQFTEIEFPLGTPFTADRLIAGIVNEKGVNITGKAKNYFNLTQKVRIDFNDDGFEVRADLFDFWNGAHNEPSAEIRKLCGNDYDFWENNQQQPALGYKWNGKQFLMISD